MSLLGNYETASVYYQGVIQQIHRLLSTIDDHGRKQKWQQIQGEVAQEYDVVKNIMQTLALFKGTHKLRFYNRNVAMSTKITTTATVPHNTSLVKLSQVFLWFSLSIKIISVLL